MYRLIFPQSVIIFDRNGLIISIERVAANDNLKPGLKKDTGFVITISKNEKQRVFNPKLLLPVILEISEQLIIIDALKILSCIPVKDA
ncbi:hypothetical protein MASR1M46_06840 [Bacteroidales bacterium]